MEGILFSVLLLLPQAAVVALLQILAVAMVVQAVAAVLVVPRQAAQAVKEIMGVPMAVFLPLHIRVGAAAVLVLLVVMRHQFQSQATVAQGLAILLPGVLLFTHAVVAVAFFPAALLRGRQDVMGQGRVALAPLDQTPQVLAAVVVQEEMVQTVAQVLLV